MRGAQLSTLTLLLAIACSGPPPADSDGGDDGAPSSSGSSSSSGGSSGASSSGGSSNGSGSSTSSSGGGSGDAGGGDGSLPSASSLAGTWDVVGATPGATPQTGTIVISADVLTASFKITSLDYRGSGSSFSATWTNGNQVTPVAAQVVSGPLDMGIFPLVLGGSWTYTDPQGSLEQCSATLQASTMTARCSNVTGWYSPLLGLVPEPQTGFTYTATRTGQLASSFGDLGGVWQTSSSPAGTGSCMVTIQGSVFSAICAGIPQWGSVQATFVNDTMVSGTTGGGVEFTAQKR